MKINSDTFFKATKTFSRTNFKAIENFMASRINFWSRTNDLSVAYAKDIFKSYFDGVDKLLKAVDVNVWLDCEVEWEPLSAKVASYALQIYDINRLFVKNSISRLQLVTYGASPSLKNTLPVLYHCYHMHQLRRTGM